MGLSPFQVVYGNNPRTPLDLVPISNPTKFGWKAEKRAREIQELHAKVRERIEKSNEQAKSYANKKKREAHFQPRDLVWIHLRKERSLSKRRSKLMPRLDGPFEILEKIGPNAYKANLSSDYWVSATFNVADLSPYYDEDEEISSLRSNPNQVGENDGNHQDQAMDEQLDSLHIHPSPKEVKNIHALVRSTIEKSGRMWADSTEN